MLFNGTRDNVAEEPLGISDEVKDIILTAIYSIAGVGICIFGVIANTINIIVFAKQGFQETVNITLFAMAISDFGSVLFLLWVGICLNPLLRQADTPFVPGDIHYITGEWPHFICVRITGWLTCLVTVERCLCVIFPLKVKTILTLTRVKLIVLAIFIFSIASMSPNFYFTRLVWMFAPEKNKTLIRQTYTDDKHDIDSVAIFVHSTAPTVFYFVVISACTVILVVNLKRQTVWRQKTSLSAGKEQQIASRDKRVIKMVATVATIFIACLLPHMLALIPTSLDPEFSLLGKRKNMFKVVGSFVLTLEAINSSVNIFIYYNMSSKYKQIFRMLLCREAETV